MPSDRSHKEVKLLHGGVNGVQDGDLDDLLRRREVVVNEDEMSAKAL